MKSKESRTRQIKFFVDLAIFLLSYFAALFVSFEGIPDSIHLRGMFLLCPFVILFRVLSFHVCSVYQITWRFFSLDEAFAVFKAVLPVTAALFLGRVFLPDQWSSLRFPVSIVFVECLFVLIGSLGVRMADRLAHERAERRIVQKRILLIGAGVVGTEFVRDLKRKEHPDSEVIGFADDDPGKCHREILGKNVLGDIAHIPIFVKNRRVDEAVITIGCLSPKDIARIIDAFRGTKIKVTYFHRGFELLYDETCIPPDPQEDSEAVVGEQLQVFKNLTGRDYDPTAETRYPVNHPFEVHKPFSDPEGLSGDLVIAAGTMIKLLHLPAGASVLDLGCGCGWTSIMLARCGFQVTGADVNDASLEIGRSNAGKIGVPVTFIKADSQSVCFDCLFDAVVIFDTLHHCLRERSVLSRAASALRPGGKIIVCEPAYPDEDRAGVLTHESAIQAMQKFGTLEKGLGTRYVIRLLYDCGFERGSVITTPGHYHVWFMARKPRTNKESVRSVEYVSDLVRARDFYD
jgi:2-polyprenyl-3-methyl-5-hydroxy-6-metoxy-1,4-benzoquinol methylase